MREPEIRDWSATAERLEAKLVFPPEAEVFQGHFPGMPVLPGVAQLFFVRRYARKAFPDFPDAWDCHKLKFRRVVAPNEALTMKVTRKKPGSFFFELAVGEEVAASGSIEEMADGSGQND